MKMFDREGAQASLNFVYLTLIVSDGLFPDMAFVIKYSALVPCLLLRLVRMAIVFDKLIERHLWSPVYTHT
jgi:hypothetical protein